MDFTTKFLSDKVQLRENKNSPLVISRVFPGPNDPTTPASRFAKVSSPIWYMVRNSCHRASVASSSISSASCRKSAEKRRTWMSNTNCVHHGNTQKGHKNVLEQMMISKTTIVFWGVSDVRIPFVFQGIPNFREVCRSKAPFSINMKMIHTLPG